MYPRRARHGRGGRVVFLVMGVPIKIPKMPWTQIGGDMNPGAHGGIIATADGHSIEIVEIQPTIASVGEGEAMEVGFPFWSKEGYYDAADLNTDDPGVRSAMQYVGLTDEQLMELTPTQRALALSEASLSSGYRTDEGPAGWAADVVPGKVKWWGSKRAAGPNYLSDEDREFRQLLRESKREGNPTAISWPSY